MDLTSRRQQLGPSVYLWMTLNATAQTSSEKWWSVASGAAYIDEDLASHLRVSAATIREWRTRLERAGLIRTTLVGRRERRYFIRNLSYGDQPSAEQEAQPNVVN